MDSEEDLPVDGSFRNSNLNSSGSLYAHGIQHSALLRHKHTPLRIYARKPIGLSASQDIETRK